MHDKTVKYVLFVWLALIVLGRLNAQPAPTAIQVQYFREVGGSTTFYYWIVAKYPYGTSPVSSISGNTGAVAPATLTVRDFVSIQWEPMSGATSYDVLRNTTGTTPTGACNCKVANLTGTSLVDQGLASLTYTVLANPGLSSTGGITQATSDFSVTGGSVPVWKKYSLVAIANAVNGCANANGCWQVNGVLGANKTAGLTQSVTLFTLPAAGYIDRNRIKTATACAGATTITLTLGTASDDNYYTTTLYNLKTAVSATNKQDEHIAVGADTAASVAVVGAIITSVENIDQITAGCAVDIWAHWGTLP